MGDPKHSVPIEYFLWTNDHKPGEKLVYYDNEGTYYEADVTSGTLDDALKYFDGKPRAVRRRSGGLVAAMPYQMVLYTADGNEKAPPSIKIRVKFRDLKVDPRGQMTSAEYVSHVKVVSPSELNEIFSYVYQGPQKFVLDFGQGIVPIHVVTYEEDLRGNGVAYFVETHDLDRVMNATQGEKTSVQTYQIAQDVLRSASDVMNASGSSDFENAVRNYLKLRELKAKIIPDFLKSGPPIEVPACQTIHDIRHFLRLMIQRQLGLVGSSSPIYISIQREESGELLPFGMLEEP